MSTVLLSYEKPTVEKNGIDSAAGESGGHIGDARSGMGNCKESYV